MCHSECTEVGPISGGEVGYLSPKINQDDNEAAIKPVVKLVVA